MFCSGSSEDDDGVGTAGAVDALQYTSRHSSYVGPAVSADLGFIVKAAKGYPLIFAAQGLCYGLAQGCLADSRRAVEADDGGLHVALELQHRQILDDPFLDCLQTEVVLVQDFLGVLKIQIVLGHLFPGQVQYELDVLVLDVVVR